MNRTRTRTRKDRKIIRKKPSPYSVSWRIAILLAVGAACDSTTEPEPSLTGTWSAVSRHDQTYTLILTDDSGTLSGSVSVTGGALGSISLTSQVTGRHTFPSMNVNFVIEAGDFRASCEYVGAVDAEINTITGRAACDFNGTMDTIELTFQRSQA